MEVYWIPNKGESEFDVDAEATVITDELKVKLEETGGKLSSLEESISEFKQIAKGYLEWLNPHRYLAYITWYYHKSQFHSHFFTFVVALHKLPVNQPNNCLKVFCPVVSIVNIISVFPDIDG